MPSYDGYTLEQVRAAIEPGRPDGITAAGAVFATAVDELTTLATGIDEQVVGVTGSDSAPWSSPAADAFTLVITALVARIRRLAATYRPYQPALNPASAALQTAKEELLTLIAMDSAARDAGPVQAAAAATELIDPAAREILTTLATAYLTARRALLGDPDDEELDGLADGPAADDLALADLDAAALAGLDPAALAGLEPAALAGIGLPAALDGLVPVDLGAGPQLALGALDSTTYLAGLDPMPNPSLVLGRGPVSPAPLAPLAPPDTALTGGGVAAPGLGLTPVSHLTTARGPAPTPAAPPPTTPGGARPPLLPMTPMAGFGPVGAPGSSSRRHMPLAGALGRPADEDEQERRSSLVGDEQWDDGAGLSRAIGREPAAEPERG